MKRFMVVLVLGALVGAIYVAAAPGGRAAKPRAGQFRALKKQMSQLRSTVWTLKETVGQLSSTVGTLQATVQNDDSFIQNCLTAEGIAPLTEYGDGATNTFGYSYSNDGSNYFPTTALDFTGSGDPTDAYVQAVSPSCLSSGTLRRAKTPGLREHLLVLPSGKH